MNRKKLDIDPTLVREQMIVSFSHFICFFHFCHRSNHSCFIWQHHIASYFEYESSNLEIELLKDREEKFGNEEEENAVGEQDMMDCGPEN